MGGGWGKGTAKYGRDSYAIPPFNYNKSSKDGSFAHSFTLVPAKNAKQFKPVLGGGKGTAK